MAASSSALPLPATSTTSSGFADGLGRRVLAFDREEGVMLERLVLRPELAAFEGILRDRVERLGSLEDERLARPRTVERDAGGLVVVSEFVPGSRLSDLLEISADLGHAPGVDAALGFLLDVLPALCGIHAGVGFAHGTITPSRTVLTPAGQIVLLDGIFGDALTYLRYSRRKLWLEFGIATALDGARLDRRADIAQAALAGVMLILGRPLRNEEYLSGLSGVLREVVDIAQIRSTTSFAIGIEEFFERALPVPSSRPYTSADDALFDVRQLANELGAQGCRRALVDFIEQMESPAPAVAESEADGPAADIETYAADPHGSSLTGAETAPDLTAGVEAEIDLDDLVEPTPYDMTASGAIDLDQPSAIDDEAVDWVQLAAASAPRPGATPPVFEPLTIERGIVEPPIVTRQAEQPIAGKAVEPPFDDERPILPESVEPQPQPLSVSPLALDARPAPSLSSPAVEHSPATPTAAITPETAPPVEPAEAATEEPASADEPPTGVLSGLRWRRAKRATKSVRARKDKLRSVSESDAPAIVPAKPIEPPPPPPPPPAPPPPPPPEVKKPASGNWLVAPDRAAAFEEMVPVTPTFAAPEPKLTSVPVYTPAQPIPMSAPPPVTLYVPPPVAPAPPIEPVFSRTVGSIAPSYDTPPAWTPPPAPAPPVKTIAPASPPVTTVRLKDPPPRPRGTRAADPVVDIYSSPSAPPPSSEPTAFPWKLAAAAGVIMVVAIIGGKVYMPAKGVPTDQAATREASTQTPAASATAAPAAGSVVANTGRLEIETQPAGARILLDGKPAGESPVALDGIAAGRHTVTFVTSSGSVKRAIRIEAGRTTKLDVPIFSGWVGIYAPFVLDVVEGGHVIGTTEEPRILLSPGKHELTLVNHELGYSSAQAVDIEPGEVKSISIDPRGHVNLNATPWAEVSIDGRKVGDTPIANLELPLGIREVTFRHPQFGERRVTVTVKGNAPAAISIDMSKP
jgi:PEGA domain-containing protein